MKRGRVADAAAVPDAIPPADGGAAPAMAAEVGAACAFEPGWTFDAGAQRVWLEPTAGRAGSAVSLRGKPTLVRLLALLVERGGSASREDIVGAVWGEPAYHPLRHDNRVKLAVHKLRKLIEVDASTPARLVTREDGYALGEQMRVPV